LKEYVLPHRAGINEKTKEWAGGSVSTYYAQGYFTWGDGEVSVSSASGGYLQFLV
jgi:hypothetical protein